MTENPPPGQQPPPGYGGPPEGYGEQPPEGKLVGERLDRVAQEMTLLGIHLDCGDQAPLETGPELEPQCLQLR